MLLPRGNPPLRHRHNVTALMLNSFRSIGPVIHRDPNAAVSLSCDTKGRFPRLARLMVFSRLAVRFLTHGLEMNRPPVKTGRF
jgi:hypothetical protein